MKSNLQDHLIRGFTQKSFCFLWNKLILDYSKFLLWFWLLRFASSFIYRCTQRRSKFIISKSIHWKMWLEKFKYLIQGEILSTQINLLFAPGKRDEDHKNVLSPFQKELPQVPGNSIFLINSFKNIPINFFQGKKLFNSRREKNCINFYHERKMERCCNKKFF